MNKDAHAEPLPATAARVPAAAGKAKTTQHAAPGADRADNNKDLTSRLAAMDAQLATLTAEVASLKESRKHLKTIAIEVRDKQNAMAQRLDHIVRFFEYRVDAIYANLHEVASADSQHSGLVPPRREADANTTLRERTEAWAPAVALSTTFAPLPVKLVSPLTLGGMRVNSSLAQERLTHIQVFEGNAGIAVYGPYRTLAPGNYKVAFELDHASRDTKLQFEVEVAAGQPPEILASATSAELRRRNWTLDFSWSPTKEGQDVEFRIIQKKSGGAFGIKEITLSER